MGTFQKAIDNLPGATCKKLDGKRRVLGLTITLDLRDITKMLRHAALAPILEESHTQALKSHEDDTQELAVQVYIWLWLYIYEHVFLQRDAHVR